MAKVIQSGKTMLSTAVLRKQTWCSILYVPLAIDLFNIVLVILI